MKKNLENFIAEKRETWVRYARTWCQYVISRDEAEDVVQEVICMLLYQSKKNDKFIRMMNKPRNNQTELDYYVIKTIRNNCQSSNASYYRKYHKSPATEKPGEILPEWNAFDPWEKYEEQCETTPEEKVKIIRTIFDGIHFSEYHRKIFIFHFFEHHSFKDWKGPETTRKLDKIYYEMKKVLVKKIKKLEEQGGIFSKIYIV